MICGFGIGMQTSARQMRKPTFSLGIKADRLVLAPFGQRNPAIEMCLHMFALMAQTDQKWKWPSQDRKTHLVSSFHLPGTVTRLHFRTCSILQPLLCAKIKIPQDPRDISSSWQQRSTGGMMCNDTHQLPLFCFNQMTRYSDNSDPLSSLKNRKVYSTISDHIQRFTDVHSTFQSS